jgi:hypothetical protein
LTLAGIIDGAARNPGMVCITKPFKLIFRSTSIAVILHSG